jgi:hypothetical protein
MKDVYKLLEENKIHHPTLNIDVVPYKVAVESINSILSHQLQEALNALDKVTKEYTDSINSISELEDAD